MIAGNRSGLIGSISSRLNLKQNPKIDDLNEAMNAEIKAINQDLNDRFTFNSEVNDIKDILKLKNNRFRSFKLTRKLHYTVQHHVLI